MTPNNTETPQETPTVKKTKAELFTENPDKFISVDDIIMAVVRSEHGLSTISGACKRIDMEIALTRITYKTLSIFQMMDLQSEMAVREKEKTNIITATNHVNGLKKFLDRKNK